MLLSLLSPPFFRGAHQFTSLTVLLFRLSQKQCVALVTKGVSVKSLAPKNFKGKGKGKATRQLTTGPVQKTCRKNGEGQKMRGRCSRRDSESG